VCMLGAISIIKRQVLAAAAAAAAAAANGKRRRRESIRSAITMPPVCLMRESLEKDRTATLGTVNSRY